MSERIAIIDLGSNSARLIIMHVHNNGSYNLIYHQKETIRLGESMGNDKCLQPEPVQRAVVALQVFAMRCQLLRVDTIIAAATAAVRKAVNGAEFIQTVRSETGLELITISGEDEADLGCLGAINTLDVDDALIFDLGGGSLELSLVRGRGLVKSTSLPLGAVNVTEQFGTQNKVDQNRLSEMVSFIAQRLNELPWVKGGNMPLIGIGGTARNLAKMVQKANGYPFAKVHGYQMTIDDVTKLWNRLISKSASQRKRMPGLSRDRADIIVAGATIIKCLIDISGSSELVVSGCGLREGLFLQHYLPQQGQSLVLPDVLRHSAENNLRFYSASCSHSLHVADLTVKLFDGWQGLHGLGTRERELLYVSALLHDIGISINYYGHPRHTAYLVENARLFGLTHREQMLCSVIAGWHEGVKDWFRMSRYQYLLSKSDWVNTRRLALLLALAEALDTCETQTVQDVEAAYDKDNAVITVKGNGRAGIEAEAAHQLSKWVSKDFARRLHLH